MSDDRIKRIELPSGGWWEIETEPKWGDIKAVLNEFRKSGDSAADVMDFVLIRFSTAWSFDDETINLETLAKRSLEDVVPVLGEVMAKVSPLLGILGKGISV